MHGYSSETLQEQEEKNEKTLKKLINKFHFITNLLVVH